MAVESRRKCGYRKVGGLYLVSGKLGAPCCKLPIPLTICPTCSGGIKQTRGWTWIDPMHWLKGECTEVPWQICEPRHCPAAYPSALGERVGLLWIGEKFYPTIEDFQTEAAWLGISRRITAIPRGFEVGKHWVFFAHPKAAFAPTAGDLTARCPGIFRIFLPERIEKIVTESQAKDGEVMAKLTERGITPVIVPDNDRDHQGSVYEDDLFEEEADATA
jgi:hypothetical protein